ncbi:M42 family metallopeptidase [[Eubacterium] hominis]|uniref:M42 family metallopeptidase n=1 Tax=[Eubacterium] hominis TaxID=2764325 RepID=UPI003A4DFBF4
MKEAYGEMNLEMIAELSEAHGISGCEKEVSRIMKKWLEPVTDEITYDNIGSIVGLQKGHEDGPKVMICGHMDEVGFMVREIDKNGFIRMLPVGGWWGHVLPAQTLYVTTKEGKRYHGVVGSSAPHGLPKDVKERVIKPVDMFLDMGVDSREEILELGIQIGDMITPDTKFEVMNNPNYLMGKAWDDRLCAALAADVLYRIQKDDHVANVYAVGTVQEEVGLRGARTAANFIHPDVAIALDVTTAMDTPADQGDIKLGGGVVLSVMDAGIIGHKALLHEMEEICRDLNLDINYDMMTVGGTDADNIHKAFDGIITMTLSIPTRYMHSHRLLIHRKDYVQTVEAIAEFCRRVNWDKIKEMNQQIR